MRPAPPTRVEANGSSNITALITGSAFSTNKGDHFQFATTADATSTSHLTFTNNTLTNTNTTGSVVVGGGVTVSTSGGADLTFLISGNNIQNAIDEAINVNIGTAATAASFVQGVISGNTIGTAGTLDSGSLTGSGIVFTTNGDATGAVRIENNTVHQWANPYGILANAKEGNGTMYATIVNNTVSNGGSFSLNGIRVDAGATAADTSQVYLELNGNNVSNVGAGNNEIQVRGRFNADIYLPGYTGGLTDTAAVDTFLTAKNPNGDPLGVSQGFTAGHGFRNTAGGAALPAIPGPTQPPTPLFATSPAPTPSGSRIESGHLSHLIAAAIARWADAGASEAQLAAMRAVSVSVGDLGGLQIGQNSLGSIVIDDDAAGWGWFVDSTPGDDAEFSGSGAGLNAAAGAGAEGRMDLLTALMHELGHQVGLDDHYTDAGEGLMYGFLDVGERHLPALDHVAELAAASGPAPTVGVTGWVTGMVPDLAGLETAGPANSMGFAPASLLTPEAGGAGVEGWVTGVVLESGTGGLDALLSGYGPSAQDGGWDGGPIAVDPWGPPPQPFDPIHPVM